MAVAALQVGWHADLSQVGTRLILSEQQPFVAGRGFPNDFTYRSARVSRRHFSVTHDAQGWWLADLQSTDGTELNGRALGYGKRAPLASGDRVAPASQEFVLVFVSGFDPGLPQEAREVLAGVDRAPEDEGRWRVLADWLLERGLPFGERMARGQPANVREAASWLCPVGAGLEKGALEASWRHGFVESLTLKLGKLQWGASWYLRTALGLPVSRFLRRLELEQPTRNNSPRPLDAPRELKEVLPFGPPFPCLESVTWNGEPLSVADALGPELWKTEAERFPRLR